MRVRRRLIALSSFAVIACGFMVPPAASATTETAMFNGIVDAGSPKSRLGYPVNNCEWITDPERISGSQLFITQLASGMATFALTSSASAVKTVAVFDTSYTQDHCLTSMLVDFRGPLSDEMPLVTIPVVAGHEYVILVWGCSGTCQGGADTYGAYILSLSLEYPDSAPPWMQAIGPDSAAAPCPVGY